MRVGKELFVDIMDVRYTNKVRSYLVRLPWFNKMRSMVLSGECRYFYCTSVSDSFYVTERLLITNGLQVISLCSRKRDNTNIDETVIDIYGNVAYYIHRLDFIPLPSIFNGFADMLFGKLAYPLNDNIHGLIDRVDAVRGIFGDTDYVQLVDDGKFSEEALKATWGEWHWKGRGHFRPLSEQPEYWCWKDSSLRRWWLFHGRIS